MAYYVTKFMSMNNVLAVVYIYLFDNFKKTHSKLKSRNKNQSEGYTCRDECK